MWPASTLASASASASASWFWPRPRPQSFSFGLGLRLLVLTSTSTSEFRPRTWPRPPPLGSGVDLGLRVSASDLASVFWPRLTSLTERLLSSPFTVLHSNVYVLSSIWWRHLVNISYIQWCYRQSWALEHFLAIWPDYTFRDSGCRPLICRLRWKVVGLGLKGLASQLSHRLKAYGGLRLHRPIAYCIVQKLIKSTSSHIAPCLKSRPLLFSP